MMSLKQTLTCCLILLLSTGLTAPVCSEESEESGENWENWEKVVFHLDETANARWALMLAQSYLDDSPKARIAFVAYGPGVDFLLEDAEDKRGDSYDHAVQGLIGRGVEFRVCAATLGARKIAREDLLDGVSVVPSGIAEIARLQLREGYAYLKP